MRLPPSNLSPGASALAYPSLSRPGPAGSDIEDLAQPPSPPPPPPPSLRAQTAPGPVKVGAVPNRRLGSVRGVPMSSPPGRRARLSYPGTSCLSSEAREELRRRLLGLIEGNRVMIFSKSYCPYSTRVGGAGAGQADLGKGPIGVGQREPGGGGVSRGSAGPPSCIPRPPDGVLPVLPSHALPGGRAIARQAGTRTRS